MAWWRRRKPTPLVRPGAVVRTEYPSPGEWVVASVSWRQDEWPPGMRMTVEFVDRETFENWSREQP